MHGNQGHGMSSIPMKINININNLSSRWESSWVHQQKHLLFLFPVHKEKSQHQENFYWYDAFPTRCGWAIHIGPNHMRMCGFRTSCLQRLENRLRLEDDLEAHKEICRQPIFRVRILNYMICRGKLSIII